MQKWLFVALGVALLTSPKPAAQSPESIQGVWRIVEANVTGPGARTIPFGDRPNLTIITAKHYSRVEDQSEKPRAVLADPAKSTADELRAVWGPFVGEAGTYELSGDNLITMRPIVSKSRMPIWVASAVLTGCAAMVMSAPSSMCDSISSQKSIRYR